MQEAIELSPIRAALRELLMERHDSGSVRAQSPVTESVKRDMNNNLEQYYARIRKAISGYTAGTELNPDDLTQETFLKAFRSLDSFAGASSVYTWLYRIARNTCIDAMRKIKRTGDKHTLSFEEELYTDHDLNLNEDLEESERQRLLKQALGNLEEEMRMLIVLKHLQQLKYEEIAEISEIEVGTVKSKLFRARARLKEELERLGVG